MKKKRQRDINSNNADCEGDELSSHCANDVNTEPSPSKKKNKTISSKESHRILGDDYKISEPKKIYEIFFAELVGNIENIKNTYDKLLDILQTQDSTLKNILNISSHATFEMNAITNLKSLAEKPLNTLIDNQKEFFDNKNSDIVKNIFFNALLPKTNTALKEHEELINKIYKSFKKCDVDYINAFENRIIYKGELSLIHLKENSNFNNVKELYNTIAENIKKNIEHVSKCNTALKNDICSRALDKKLKVKNAQDLIVKKKNIDDLVIKTLNVLLQCFKDSLLAFADFSESNIYGELAASLNILNEEVNKINNKIKLECGLNNLSKNSTLTFSSSSNSFSLNLSNYKYNPANFDYNPPTSDSNNCNLDLTPISTASSISNTPRIKLYSSIDKSILPDQINLTDADNIEDFESTLMRSPILTPPFNNSNKPESPTVLSICKNLNNDITSTLLTFTPLITSYNDVQLNDNTKLDNNVNSINLKCL